MWCIYLHRCRPGWHKTLLCAALKRSLSQHQGCLSHNRTTGHRTPKSHSPGTRSDLFCQRKKRLFLYPLRKETAAVTDGHGAAELRFHCCPNPHSGGHSQEHSAALIFQLQSHILRPTVAENCTLVHHDNSRSKRKGFLQAKGQFVPYKGEDHTQNFLGCSHIEKSFLMLVGYFFLGFFSPADSNVRGHGPRYALIWAQVALSKSFFVGVLPN